MSDEFQDRKGIHVKLDKEIHNALRIKLFKQHLSMQEVFEEFARQLASDTKHAEFIMNSLVTRKLKALLAGESITKKRAPAKQLNELDSERLYNLINDDKKNE